MNLEPLVRATVERLADVVPLSPMAKLEIDGILTAMAEEVKTGAIEAVAGEANRLGFASSDEYYNGYKNAIANALAALRAAPAERGEGSSR